jgi:hypothetical protein
MSLSRLLPVFSITFCIIYVVGMYFNLPAFTYVPKAGTFHLFYYAPPGNLAPGIFWFGWLLTSTIGACVLTGAAIFAPPQAVSRLPVAALWIVPLALTLFVLYDLRPWFTH